MVPMHGWGAGYDGPQPSAGDGPRWAWQPPQRPHPPGMEPPVPPVEPFPYPPAGYGTGESPHVDQDGESTGAAGGDEWPAGGTVAGGELTPAAGDGAEAGGAEFTRPPGVVADAGGAGFTPPPGAVTDAGDGPFPPAAGAVTGAGSPGAGPDAAGVPDVVASGAPGPGTAPSAGPSAPPCPGGRRVQVQPGDSLFLLAQRHGVPLAAVILANPHLRDAGRIHPGQWVCIPSAPPRCPGGRLVTAEPGDTLFALAERYGVPLQALVAANPQVEDPDRIVPGQVVCIPRSPAGCGGSLYVVEPGETLFAIGQRFGVSWESMVAANPQITQPDRIYPGEVICIPAPADG